MLLFLEKVDLSHKFDKNSFGMNLVDEVDIAVLQESFFLYESFLSILYELYFNIEKKYIYIILYNYDFNFYIKYILTVVYCILQIKISICTYKIVTLENTLFGAH